MWPSCFWKWAFLLLRLLKVRTTVKLPKKIPLINIVTMICIEENTHCFPSVSKYYWDIKQNVLGHFYPNVTYCVLLLCYFKCFHGRKFFKVNTNILKTLHPADATSKILVTFRPDIFIKFWNFLQFVYKLSSIFHKYFNQS